MNAKRRDYVELPDEELSPEQVARARAAIAQAEQDVDAMRKEFLGK